MVDIDEYLLSVKGLYLGQGITCLEIFRKLDADDLFKIVSDHVLPGLLLTSSIAGLETYLRDRLFVETFSDYNHLLKYISLYKGSNKEQGQALMAELQSNLQLSKDSQILIEESINTHIYHRLKMVNHFFQNVSGIRIDNIRNYDEIRERIIITLRHKVVHEAFAGTIDVATVYRVNEIL